MQATSSDNAGINLLAALPDAAFVVGMDLRVTACNSLAFGLLGSDPVGQDITQLIRSQIFANALQRARDGDGKVEFDMELFGIKRQLARVFIDRVQTTDKLLIVARDSTFEQAVEKMRSDFVANASHEMRTPLASVIGGIETLMGAAKNDTKARDQFLALMLAQAQRMKRLIDDLLTLSRIELNEHVQPAARVDLSEVARQARSNLSDAAEKAGVVLILSGGGKVTVPGDAEELLQVAQNLLENAIKYGGAGGRVEVDCFSQENHGCLSVRDFGKGIADIHLPRLTERFYRVNTQESRSRGGTGLGLAIVKHIVLRHRGKLAIQSKEGVGSTFTVSIPLMES
jgi:two-component system phosphate regulon sensor histidine kinase PhoR